MRTAFLHTPPATPSPAAYRGAGKPGTKSRAGRNRRGWEYSEARRRLLQRLEADAPGLGAFFAEAFLLVGFVFLVIAREEVPLRFAFAGEDVRGDAVEEPAIVRDHQHR